jgi:hypothetical protein
MWQVLYIQATELIDHRRREAARTNFARQTSTTDTFAHSIRRGLAAIALAISQATARLARVLDDRDADRTLSRESRSAG